MFLEAYGEIRPPACNGNCHLYGNPIAMTGITVCDSAKTNGLQGVRETSKFIPTKDKEKPKPPNNKN